MAVCKYNVALISLYYLYAIVLCQAAPSSRSESKNKKPSVGRNSSLVSAAGASTSHRAFQEQQGTSQPYNPFLDEALVDRVHNDLKDIKTNIAIQAAKEGFGGPDDVWKDYYDQGDEELLYDTCHKHLVNMGVDDREYAKSLVLGFCGGDTAMALASKSEWAQFKAVGHFKNLEAESEDDAAHWCSGLQGRLSA